MRDNMKAYRFSKGEKYSCDVVVLNDDTILFHNMKCPVDTTDEVKMKLLEDAESFVLKQIEKEKDAIGHA